MSGKKIERIEDLMAISHQNISILEEEIDLNVQKRYFIIAKRLSRQTINYKERCEKSIKNIDDLYSAEVDNITKKNMLVTLASIADVEIYRAIEQFSKQEGVLQKWSIIALQQSRISIQNKLLDIPCTFISSGLGGKGDLLRYFCVLFYDSIKDFQKKILKEELNIMIDSFNGFVEEFSMYENYSTMTILLPINVDITIEFRNVVDECNVYGSFLKENILITNTKRMSSAEIEDVVTRLES